MPWGYHRALLSRTIRELESELGVTLFERTTHSVTLTPAGTVLLDQARNVLDSLQAAARRTQRAGSPEPKLVLAVKADADGGLLKTILAAYAAEPASGPVEVRLCGWGEQPRLLRRGEADAALIYEPFDHTGLDSETLAVEPRVVALASTHVLAGRDRVSIADLPLSDSGGLHRFLDQIAEEHQIHDLSQLLIRVEFGDIVFLLPESVATRYPRSGIAYRSVPDAPPARLAIAWPQQSRSLATAALVRSACSLSAR